MGASAGKPPSAPDPNQVLALQNQYNRSNAVGPLGSQSWSSGGPGGHETLTTNLSPQMQGAMDRAFAAAGTPYQKEYVPQGLDQLTSALLGTVGKRYGLSGPGLNTNLQQQKPASGMSPQAPNMAGMGIQTQQPGGMNPAQLMQNPGAMGGMGGMGGLMGPSGGGFSGANPMMAMQAMQGPNPQGGGMGMPNVQMQQPGQMPLQRFG